MQLAIYMAVDEYASFGRRCPRDNVIFIFQHFEDHLMSLCCNRTTDCFIDLLKFGRFVALSSTSTATAYRNICTNLCLFNNSSDLNIHSIQKRYALKNFRILVLYNVKFKEYSKALNKIYHW